MHWRITDGTGTPSWLLLRWTAFINATPKIGFAKRTKKMILKHIIKKNDFKKWRMIKILITKKNSKQNLLLAFSGLVFICFFSFVRWPSWWSGGAFSFSFSCFPFGANLNTLLAFLTFTAAPVDDLKATRAACIFFFFFGWQANKKPNKLPKIFIQVYYIHDKSANESQYAFKAFFTACYVILTMGNSKTYFTKTYVFK